MAGEGKSMSIICVAAILELRGLNVDIMTTS
jgi:hypothetical protein